MNVNIIYFISYSTNSEVIWEKFKLLVTLLVTNMMLEYL